MRRRILAILAVALLGLAALIPHGTRAAGCGDFILLHGWNGDASSWATAQTFGAQRGCTVHALSLPRGGWNVGDTDANAAYVQAYIASNHLDHVTLVGHSLGGWAALDEALVLRDPAVAAVVLLDTGDGCWFKIPPDQCPGSKLLTAIAKALASSVPILNLSSSTAARPQVDCLRVFNLDHPAFQTDPAVLAMAFAWPTVNPCASVPTATPTASPSPTVTPTRTPVPTRTPTPAPCVWTYSRATGWVCR